METARSQSQQEKTIELPIDNCADAANVSDPYTDLGRAVFPGIETRFSDEQYLLAGAVLATMIEEVGEINNAITDRFPGELYELKRADSVARGEDA